MQCRIVLDRVITAPDRIITSVKLEQLECLRSENTPRCPIMTHTSDSHQIPSQNNT